MSARLAFTVATDDPDIPWWTRRWRSATRFQRKCHDRMAEITARGKTFMLVSHSTDSIRDNCERAIWLHHGSIVRDGDAEAVTQAYHEWSLGESDQVLPAVPPVSRP
jgi:ABC-type polysaccharide/polyol phosphate transport system ATPase subunit